MQLDLLDSNPELTLPPCSEFHRGFLLDRGVNSQELMKTLVDEIAWEKHLIKIAGRETPCPRMSYWMGEAVYSYSGTIFQPHPWHPAVLQVKQLLEEETGVLFNSVLMNYYRDGQDYIGFHRDDEIELGKRPVIASVSLGGTRDFVVKSKTEKWIVPLEDDSMFLMKEDFQKRFQHGVPKRSRMILPRINLTFRYISTLETE